MAYTLSYLRNRILEDKLDDPDYDPAIVDRFLKDAQRKIYNSYTLPFMEKTFEGALPPGGHLFNLPDDAQIPHALKIWSDDPERNTRFDLTKFYMDFRSFNNHFPDPASNSAMRPSRWTIYAGRLKFSAPTDENYTMSMDYIQTAPTLEADDDVPGIPEEFEELLVLGGFYRVLRRNEDYDLAAAVKQEYQEQLDEMLYRYGIRQAGTPVIMRQPRQAYRRR